MRILHVCPWLEGPLQNGNFCSSALAFLAFALFNGESSSKDGLQGDTKGRHAGKG